jgi:hypothetical protein
MPLKRKDYARHTREQLFRELARTHARIDRIKHKIVLAVGDKPHKTKNLTSWQMCHLNCALKETDDGSELATRQ